MGEPEIADHEATHLMHSRRLHPAVKKTVDPSAVSTAWAGQGR